MRQVVADKDRAFEFVNSLAPINRTEHQRGLCQVQDGEVIGAVVYDEFNGTNILMHCAGIGRRWLSKWFLHEAFKYPFVELGCHRITLWINSANTDSIRFAEHLGFQREAVLQQAGPGRQDVFLYVMFRKNCRYA